MNNSYLILGIVAILLAVGIVLTGIGNSQANLAGKVNPTKSPNKCTTIQSGEIVASNGDKVEVGYDEYGYNYQAHMFNGRYCDYDRVIGGDDYCDVDLQMKWNDAWLSNKDCDGDNLLDRHYGHDSYIGSGAWLTNHQAGEYEEEGKKCKWTYFVKIIAAPESATLKDGIWYNSEGEEIGPVLWGSFARVQSVYNDECAGEHGVEYLSPTGPGLGNLE